MLNLDVFNMRMQHMGGTTIRDENIKNAKKFYESTFYDDASYNPNIILWNSESLLKCRLSDRKKSSTYGETCVIQIMIDETFAVGDIVFDTKRSEYWLCLQIYDIGESIRQGLLGLCNYILKFQSADGTVLSYPCIDTTSNTVGVDENNVITTGNAIHTIKLPFDDNTVLINTDDRFIIDADGVEIPQVYAVSKPNRTEFKYGDKGLIELTMRQSEYNQDKDRKDLGVCDYFDPIIIPLPPENESYADLNVNGSLILGGNPRTITSIFYVSEGVVNNNVVAVWDIELPVGYENYFTITYGINTCTVQVSDQDYDLMDYSPIIVNVSDGNGGYVGTISVNIEGGW